MKKKPSHMEEVLKGMPPIDLDSAHKAMESGTDGSEFGLPEGFQWLVAMHDAYKKLQELDVRRVQLEAAFFSFRQLFEGKHDWPGTQRKDEG